MVEKMEDLETADAKDQLPPVKDKFPTVVIIIIIAEFCERFSFSGMRAFLTIYLRSKLGYSDEGATETYHVFSTFVYIFPIIGGILADNFVGKYRTILYMMFVYAAGNLLVAIAAIPDLALPVRLCTLLGLLMITVGAGGIKPCVTAFGGDQFILPQQEKHLAVYFSILYFTLCSGSLIAKTVSPILRSEVHCFGDKDCYSLAFGAPGFVVLVAIVIFVTAKSRYVLKKPEGNVVLDFIKCVALGLKNAIVNKNNGEKHSHWLDSTRHQYDKRFVRDVKKTLSILMLFTVLPVFWSLLDQMGSRWTLQATKMDGRFGFLSIKPDQMQVLAPVFILICIPLFQNFLYPFLEKRNIMKNPLHRLTVGGVLAALAFIASASVEMYLKTTYPQLPQPGYSQLRIFNGNPCSISIQSHTYNITYTIPTLSFYTKKDFRVDSTLNLTLELGGHCIEPRPESFLLVENQAISFFLSHDEVIRYEDLVEKSKAGFPVVRFLSSSTKGKNLTMYNHKQNAIETTINSGVSSRTEVFASKYSIRDQDDIVLDEIEMENGGVYAIVVDDSNGKAKAKVLTITKANSITMALLLPQFLIMSIAEVLFAITGNEFAFKESPESMKAVLTAVWLLTEALGNVIIIIITRIFVNYRQETQSFIYTGIMLVAIVVFHHLSKGYQFREGIEVEDKMLKKERRRDSEVLYQQVKQAEDCLDH